MTWNETDVNRSSIGTFDTKTFGQPEFGFSPAPSAEVRTESSRAELSAYCEGIGIYATPMESGFDQPFHGDPDGARVAALARAEGVLGSSSSDWTDGTQEYHDVFLARTDDDGISRVLRTPFTTGRSAEPKTAQVLNALLTDSAGLNDVDGVEDWADQFGYDLELEGDTVRAAYEAVLDQDANLRDFLGEKYDTYLWGDQ